MKRLVDNNFDSDVFLLTSRSHMCFKKPRLWWLLETHVASRGILGGRFTCTAPSGRTRGAPPPPRAYPRGCDPGSYKSRGRPGSTRPASHGRPGSRAEPSPPAPA